jgi:hypothetical protein
MKLWSVSSPKRSDIAPFTEEFAGSVEALDAAVFAAGDIETFVA